MLHDVQGAALRGEERAGIALHPHEIRARLDRIAIFDGQHRACAAARLLSSPDFEVDGDDLHADFPLLVEVYPVRSEREVKELYLEYNKGENVREIDLPDAVAPDLKKFIDHAVDALATASA